MTSQPAGAPFVVDAEGVLDSTTVLRRRSSPDVEWVEVEGQIVAWNENTQALQLLDPIASLVYQLLDGRSALGEIIVDLGAEFGREVAEVESDVLQLASSLLSMNLVERAS